MYLNLNTILLGAAIATSAPFAPNNTLAHNGTFINSTLPQQSTKRFPPANSADGSAPTNSTRQLSLGAEVKKCDLAGYVACDFLGQPTRTCLEQLNKYGNCTVQEIIDELHRHDGNGKMFSNRQDATGGFQVGSDGKIVHGDATGGYQSTKSTRQHIPSVEIKGCNFKGYEECISRGSSHKDCGKELFNGGACSVQEVIEYVLRKGEKNPKRGVGGGYQMDSDVKLVYTDEGSNVAGGYQVGSDGKLSHVTHDA